MKNNRLIPMVLLATAAVLVSGCGSNADNTKTSSETASNATEAIEAAIEAAQQGSDGITMEDDLGSNEGVDLTPYEKIYSFTLDGEEYHLSGKMQDLFEDGWVFLDEYITMDGTDVVTLTEAIEKGTTFDAVETPDYTLCKTVDGTTYQMMVGIYSDTNEMKTLNDFYLGYLYVKEDSGLQLELATGITFGATVEEVKETYGDPVSESSGVLSYMFTDGDVAFMPDRPEFMNFYVKDGKVYMISMQYFPVMSK